MLAMAYRIGHLDGRREGAWGAEAVERRISGREHGYIMGGTDQLLGTYDRQRFVAEQRRHAGKGD